MAVDWEKLTDRLKTDFPALAKAALTAPLPDPYRVALERIADALEKMANARRD